MKLLKISLCSLFIIMLPVTFVTAQSITGEGYGMNEQAARQMAIMDLVGQIEVKVSVKTGSASIDESQGSGSSNDFASISDIIIESNTILLGLKLETKSSGIAKTPFVARAELEASKSLPLYVKKLADLHKMIQLQAQKDASPRLLAPMVDDYEKVRKVALLLGAAENDCPLPPYSLAELKKKIQESALVIDSLDRAAALLGYKLFDGIKNAKNLVYIEIPGVKGNTPANFAIALRNRTIAWLTNYGLVLSDLASSPLVVRGTYTVLREADNALKGVELVLSLMDVSRKDGAQLIKSASVLILPQAITPYGAP